MQKMLLTIASLALAHSMAMADTATYTIDKMHTTVGFSIRHMMISNVKGHFEDVSGTITMDEKNVAKDAVDVTIQTASIKTGVDKRDDHLKSPDFFDVAKYPTMTFKSTKVKGTKNKLTVTGDLTLHGKTKPVVLAVEYIGSSKGMDGAEHAGFTATAKINRQDFGLTWQKPMEKAGAVMVGDDVTLNFDVEAVQDAGKGAAKDAAKKD